MRATLREVTVRTADAEAAPSVAVIVTSVSTPGRDVATVKNALLSPAATIRVPGTDASSGWEAVNVTVIPPAGAAAESCNIATMLELPGTVAGDVNDSELTVRAGPMNSV